METFVGEVTKANGNLLIELEQCVFEFDRELIKTHRLEVDDLVEVTISKNTISLKKLELPPLSDNELALIEELVDNIFVGQP